MPVPDWRIADPAENPWDRITLADALIVGCLVTVDVDPVGRSLDVQRPKGKDGAKLKDNGVDPAKVEITIGALTKERADFVESVIEQIDPSAPGYKAQPIGVDYPSLASRNITSIVVSKVRPPRPVKGVMTWVISALQDLFVAEKTTVGGKGSAAQRANDALEARRAIEREYLQSMADITRAERNGDMSPEEAAVRAAEANARRAADEGALAQRLAEPSEAANVARAAGAG